MASQPKQGAGPAPSITQSQPTLESSSLKLEASEAEQNSRAVRQEQREIEDLEAQQSMAKSAYDMKRLTLIQLFVSIVTLAFLWINFLQAREASRAATKAAIAAEASVKVASDTAEKQLRAYVLPDKREITDLDKSWQVTASIGMKNFGQTPAKNLRGQVIMLLGDHPLKVSLPEIPFSEQTASRGNLGPGAENVFRPPAAMKLGEEEFKGLKSGSLAIYVYGEVRYDDVYGNAHTTTYRFFTGGNSGIHGTRLFMHAEGNSST